MHSEIGIPKVSISAEAAFSDRENPSESIFKDADKALYHVKKTGETDAVFNKEKAGRTRLSCLLFLYSTVTLFARFLGLSTSRPFATLT